MHEYKDPERLTRIAVAATFAYMGFSLLLGAWALAELIAPAPFDSQRLFAYAIVAMVSGTAMIACMVIVGMWIYRISANAHSISDEMTISPGWAVGWYFVPIMNLFRPFQAMKEAWMASHYRGNWQSEPAPGLLVWWWTLWLATSVLGNISLQLNLRSPDGTAPSAALVIDVIVAILDVPLCLVLVTMMRRLCGAQLHARHDEVFA